MHHHIYPSHMELKRVKLSTQLCTQIYTEVGVLHRDTTSGTIAFTEHMNDLFDATNSRHPNEGLRVGFSGLEFIKNSLKWLDNRDQDFHTEAISEDMFLAQSMAEGLRVTMSSMLALSEYLLNQCGF